MGCFFEYRGAQAPYLCHTVVRGSANKPTIIKAMRYTDFETYLDTGEKPIFTNETERCLWLVGMGQWEQAHDMVESLPEPGASWIHGMLHREEGDRANAAYWYHRAEKGVPKDTVSLREELLSIAKALLNH